MVKLLVAIIKIISLPLYLLGMLIPKNKNIWIFGTGNGRKYNENSKALFEYVVKNKKTIRAIWLTRNEEIRSQLDKKNKEVYAFYSLKGIYFSLISKILVISTSFYDIGFVAYLFPRNVKIIQLWHGTPLKKLRGSSLRFGMKVYLKKFLPKNTFLWIFVQYIGRHSDLIISATDKNIKIYKELGHKNVKITGQPRNDILFKIIENSDKKKTFFYLPTYRAYGNDFDFFFQYGFDLEKMDSFLEKNNVSLLIKFHPCDEKQNKKLINSFSNTKNIFLSQDNDIYKLLPKIDALLTDYSSIYFDFLLLNRPIIFTPFDFEKYKKLNGFYYNYNLVTPGPKAKDWKEVLVYMQEAVKNPNKYQKQRKKINDMFNKYKDGKSSERVFQEILKINS